MVRRKGRLDPAGREQIHPRRGADRPGECAGKPQYAGLDRREALRVGARQAMQGQIPAHIDD